ncbi:MAG: phage Gp37/Gp68 family protein [Candidatus Nitrohelix vancouverensis]|uniref:Phage Gp37/Gp68 family protein n=1 Tax=Candidatus Nitrohelix vancouverensis TaxID=2705534 RepID=A0A7T0C160_9BACT|nr:MAG: phage Gp37/Gp68 family protein [Candidatus Nitrohelix vancouverensis]
MSSSKIEWTEHTWNPVTGCDKVSPGCANCYAETLAKRLTKMGAPGYDNGFQLTLHPDRLDIPILRKKPTIYFVNSMSDLFHEKVPFRFIDKVLQTICLTPQHIYQILTKRPERMKQYFIKRKVPRNAWLGISIENEEYAIQRLPHLEEIHAHIRFLSIEPLLSDVGELNLSGIDWVIVGGESGPKARPMKLQWVQSIQRQCEVSGVPFFFKQWGSYGKDGIRRAKKHNGRELDGRTWDDLPQIGKEHICQKSTTNGGMTVQYRKLANIV